MDGQGRDRVADGVVDRHRPLDQFHHADDAVADDQGPYPVGEAVDLGADGLPLGDGGADRPFGHREPAAAFLAWAVPGALGQQSHRGAFVVKGPDRGELGGRHRAGGAGRGEGDEAGVVATGDLTLHAQDLGLAGDVVLQLAFALS